MNKQDLLGRVMMSVATIMVGLLPIAVDLSASHVLNPTWNAHARLHEVWLLGSSGLLAIVALYLIWLHRSDRRFATLLAGVITAGMLGGFFIAAATASLYGGLLVDPLTAYMMPNQDYVMGVPLNLAIFFCALIILIAGMALARTSRAP